MHYSFVWMQAEELDCGSGGERAGCEILLQYLPHLCSLQMFLTLKIGTGCPMS